jgi:hypothetical protein
MMFALVLHSALKSDSGLLNYSGLAGTLSSLDV